MSRRSFVFDWCAADVCPSRKVPWAGERLTQAFLELVAGGKRNEPAVRSLIDPASQGRRRVGRKEVEPTDLEGRRAGKGAAHRVRLRPDVHAAHWYVGPSHAVQGGLEQPAGLLM